MNTISNYLETMFINLPETPELMQLKIDLLANMEDKYNELITEGHSENEAIGTVIGEFGNIDEILTEMEIDISDKEDEVGELPVLSLTDALDYVADKRKIGTGIGLGVILSCLAGATLFYLLGVTERAGVSLGMVIPISIGGLLAVAIAVGLFIVYGFRNNRYEYLQKGFVITGSTRKGIEDSKRGYERTHIFSITVGVFLCILALVPLLVSSLSFGPNPSNILYGLALMAAIAGLGSFFFVYTGNISLAYSILLNHGQLEQPTPVAKKKTKLNRMFSNVYWPIVTLLFFFLGFSNYGWGFGTSWLIFPLAGILEEVIKNIVAD